MAEFIADPNTPCRPCRGTGNEETGHGGITRCFDCGGSGRKSVRIDQRDPVATGEDDHLSQGWPFLLD